MVQWVRHAVAKIMLRQNLCPSFSHWQKLFSGALGSEILYWTPVSNHTKWSTNFNPWPSLNHSFVISFTNCDGRIIQQNSRLNANIWQMFTCNKGTPSTPTNTERLKVIHIYLIWLHVLYKYGYVLLDFQKKKLSSGLVPFSVLASSY